MKILAVALLCSVVLVIATSAQADTREIVEFPSGSLHLKAYLWRPIGAGPFPAVLFNHGSGGPDAFHTSGMTMTEAAERLGPLFASHGYIFLFSCRRGQGLSVGQGKFIQDDLKDEERTRGPEARQKRQIALMTGSQLDDALAGLTFLRTRSDVDSHRIAVIGHSFGGQLTILEAVRDRNVRAAITFGAAANSWAKSPELRKLLLMTIDKLTVPIMLIHAANDYDTRPGRDLAAELQARHKPHVLKIYPAVGNTPDEGHNQVYTGVPEWEADVFRFLQASLHR